VFITHAQLSVFQKSAISDHVRYTLSPEAVAEDGVFRHPYLVRRDFALVGEQDGLPLPEFAICHTPLPADFCTCGRYALFEMESEEDWS
jgi:hypothetical protein